MSRRRQQTADHLPSEIAEGYVKRAACGNIEKICCERLSLAEMLDFLSVLSFALKNLKRAAISCLSEEPAEAERFRPILTCGI